MISLTGVAEDKFQFSAFLIADMSVPFSQSTQLASSQRALGGISAEYRLSENWSAYGSLQAFRGDDGSQVTEDIQVYSNIDADEFSGIFDAWVEGTFEASGTRIFIGQFDANSLFAVPDNAQNFINSSMGFSPTITFMPTYPVPTLGVATTQSLGSEVSVSLGLFSDEDNKFDQRFSIAELVWQPHDLTVKAGAWHWDGKPSNAQGTKSANSTRGIYIVAEGPLLADTDGSNNIYWFAQGGLSEAETNPLRSHIGAGIEVRQLAGNPAQRAGFGLTRVGTSSEYFAGAGPVNNAETALEVFYQYTLNDHLLIKPDLQYIVAPSFDANRDNVWVATLRLEMGF